METDVNADNVMLKKAIAIANITQAARPSLCKLTNRQNMTEEQNAQMKSAKRAETESTPDTNDKSIHKQQIIQRTPKREADTVQSKINSPKGMLLHTFIPQKIPARHNTTARMKNKSK